MPSWNSPKISRLLASSPTSTTTSATSPSYSARSKASLLKCALRPIQCLPAKLPQGKTHHLHHQVGAAPPRQAQHLRNRLLVHLQVERGLQDARSHQAAAAGTRQQTPSRTDRHRPCKLPTRLVPQASRGSQEQTTRHPAASPSPDQPRKHTQNIRIPTAPEDPVRIEEPALPHHSSGVFLKRKPSPMHQRTFRQG